MPLQTTFIVEGHNLRWEYIGRYVDQDKATSEMNTFAKIWPDRIFRVVARSSGGGSKVIGLYDPRGTDHDKSRPTVAA